MKYLIFEDISDNSAQQILQYFDRSNEFIKNALDENGTNRVLVHCAAGISRSGAFCCAYMIQHGKLTLAQALEHGRARRTNFHPNTNFQAQLRVFEKVIIDGETKSTELKGAGFMS